MFLGSPAAPTPILANTRIQFHKKMETLTHPRRRRLCRPQSQPSATASRRYHTLMSPSISSIVPPCRCWAPSSAAASSSRLLLLPPPPPPPPPLPPPSSNDAPFHRLQPPAAVRGGPKLSREVAAFERVRWTRRWTTARRRRGNGGEDGSQQQRRRVVMAGGGV